MNMLIKLRNLNNQIKLKKLKILEIILSSFIKQFRLIKINNYSICIK